MLIIATYCYEELSAIIISHFIHVFASYILLYILHYHEDEGFSYILATFRHALYYFCFQLTCHYYYWRNTYKPLLSFLHTYLVTASSRRRLPCFEEPFHISSSSTAHYKLHYKYYRYIWREESASFLLTCFLIPYTTSLYWNILSASHASYQLHYTYVTYIYIIYGSFIII